MSDAKRTAVIGGGISGVAAAFALHQAGHDVELIERHAFLGGRCAPGTLGERAVTFGGKNIGRRYTRLRAFTTALGDHPYEPFGINSSRIEHGRIVTLDSRHRLRSLRTVARMGTARDLARLMRLARRVRAEETNRYLGSPYFRALSQRHDHAPLSAHFSHRLTKSLLRPVTVRMNGAEPDEVFLGTFGTNLGMLMDSFDQLSHGIEPVLRAFAERVPVRLGTQATDLLLHDGMLTGIRVIDDTGTAEERAYDGILLATPAHAAADLLTSTLPDLARRLRGVRYFPGAVVLAEYDRPIFTHDVRALVFDEGPCSNAGAYGIEDRHIVRYTFSGRAARDMLADDPDLEQLTAAGEAQLAPHMPIASARHLALGTRHWHEAYCGYAPFHGTFLDGLREALATIPGLELAGDYLRGALMEACFRSGEEAAQRLAAHLSSRAGSVNTTRMGDAPVLGKG